MTAEVLGGIVPKLDEAILPALFGRLEYVQVPGVVGRGVLFGFLAENLGGGLLFWGGLLFGSPIGGRGQIRNKCHRAEGRDEKIHMQLKNGEDSG